MAGQDPDSEAARQDLSRFLSACFYEPTPMFAEERMFESMHAAAQRVDPELTDLARRLGRSFAEVDLQTLLVDYARLFLGPVDPRAMPYGSCYLTGERALMGDSTMAVLELYREGGFEIDQDFRDLPDHVAVELEFLYVLSFRHDAARRNGDATTGDAVGTLRQKFLAEHLGAWVPDFTKAMREGAQTAFYRELAELTRLWVQMNLAAATAH